MPYTQTLVRYLVVLSVLLVCKTYTRAMQTTESFMRFYLIHMTFQFRQTT
jgi:hypothetical protein